MGVTMTIVVFGDYISDLYIYGKVERISPESPIPIFQETRREYRDGGAGNVCANLRALGNNPDFYTNCRNHPIKTRYVCDNHILFRSDEEKYHPKEKPFSVNLSGVRYCVLSDYNKGYLHNSQQLVDHCISQGCKVIVDPKKPLDNYKNSTIIKMNAKEYEDYGLGLSPKEIRRKFNIESLIITHGKEGVLISSDVYEGIISATEHQVSDVTGAGDVFIAAMTHYLNKNYSLYYSCLRACRLASISVTKFGTYVLTEDDIASIDEKVVFTNGCFDIIHKGHIEYLKKSKALGKKLIVGLNSDDSIKRLKGQCRPINSQDDRKAVLESLDCIDEVIIFDEDTPYNLIKKIQPDIITKGGDYMPSNVVGNDLARVIIIPFVEGYSTTNILEKINV